MRLGSVCGVTAVAGLLLSNVCATTEQMSPDADLLKNGILDSPNGLYKARRVGSQTDVHYEVSDVDKSRIVLTTRPQYPSPNDVKAGGFSPDSSMFAALYYYIHDGSYSWVGVWSTDSGDFLYSRRMDGFTADLTGVFEENDSVSQPEAGTRAYFERYIEDRYQYEAGKMVRLRYASRESLSATPRVLSSFGNMTVVQGAVEHISSNAVILATSGERMDSGAEKTEYIAVELHSITNLSVGHEISASVKEIEKFNCVLASGVTNILKGYKEIQTITFEQYMEVFKSDSQSEPLGEVVRLERRKAHLGFQSYRERLKARREQIDSKEEFRKHLRAYQMELIRAKGEKGPPLPIPLTPEQDAQLVEEGVLPDKE